MQQLSLCCYKCCCYSVVTVVVAAGANVVAFTTSLDFQSDLQLHWKSFTHLVAPNVKASIVKPVPSRAYANGDVPQQVCSYAETIPFQSNTFLNAIIGTVSVHVSKLGTIQPIPMMIGIINQAF